MTNANYQTGILADVPEQALYLLYSITSDNGMAEVLGSLAKLVDGESVVAGLGEGLIDRLPGQVTGLRTLSAHSINGIDAPSTPQALLLWLRGKERGELAHQARRFNQLLSGSFQLQNMVDGFCYQGGRDLTGYEYGTENPVSEDAISTAFASGEPGMSGSSFLALQQWRHDMSAFDTYTTSGQDLMIGRHIADNEEIDDAPQTAHVKRTAQESFEPEAFVLRRFMPWRNAGELDLSWVMG